MADFELFRHERNKLTLERIGEPCEDLKAVREFFAARGRLKDEQFIVMQQGMIYAVERADGKGLVMMRQDSQSQEDQYWYPTEKERSR